MGRAKAVTDRIRINLLGAFEVRGDDGVVLTPRSRKGRAALAMILLSPGGAVSREKIAGTLWGDKTDVQARANLRQCVRELRSTLNNGCERVIVDGSRVALDMGMVSIDVHEIVETAQHRFELPDNLRDLERGQLLDTDQPDEGAFDEWLYAERMSWNNRIRIALETLMRSLLERACWDDLERAAFALLRYDTAHEEAHRALIHCFAMREDFGSAIRQYKAAEESLQREYNIAPSAETKRLYLKAIEARTAQTDGEIDDDVPNFDTLPVARSRAIPITVLPFRSKGRGQGEASVVSDLGRGLGAALVTALSRFRAFMLISCSLPPSMEDDERFHPQEIGRILGVDYYVTGSVRVSGARIRIAVELVNCKNSEVVWADRFDGTLENIFDFEDEVASQIAGRIDPCIVWSENKRLVRYRPTNLAAYEHVLLAIPAIYRSDKEAFFAAGEALKSAVSLDPNYSDAHAWRAFWCLHSVGQGWNDAVEDAVLEAGERAATAMALDPSNALAMALAGHVESFLHRRLDNAFTLLSRSLDINPNSSFAWAISAALECYFGRPQRALARMAEYQRLCPFDPAGCYFRTVYIIAHTIGRNFEAAIEIGAEVISGNSHFANAYKPYVVSLWHAGQECKAREAAAALLRLEPDFTIEKFRRVYPFRRSEDIDLYAEAFLPAGIPLTFNAGVNR